MKINNNVKIVFINLTIVFIIAIYGTFRCSTTSFKDPLTGCVSDNKNICQFIDGWGILHFFYFMLLAYFFPENLTSIFVMGVLWEMVESYSADHPFYLAKCKYTITTDDKKGWWYGRWQDIVMNTLGMLCGYYLVKIYPKNNKQVKKSVKKSKKKK